MLHKPRGAMVAPERESLKGEVEVDEFFLGGYEEGLRGGRQRGKKALVGVAVEVRGRGSGRLRLQVLKDASGHSLGAFVTATTAAGAVVHTDGWNGYNGLRELGYDHRPRHQSAAPGEQLLPRAHRTVSNLKAWMHGTTAASRPAPADMLARSGNLMRVPNVYAIPPDVIADTAATLVTSALTTTPGRSSSTPKMPATARILD
jgi:hypothetical protein